MVSVIIPAYNCEQYIEECVTSILEQTYENFEVLIVDDGSTDHTAEIAQKLMMRDTRVEVISMKNQGVSHARNVGLANAKGEFVTFLDADDYLSPYILEKAVGCVRPNLLTAWGYTIIGRNSKENVQNCVIDKYEAIASAICTRQKVDYYLGDNFRAVWGKLFDREIILEHSIAFPEDLPVGEDALFLLQYLALCDGVNYIGGEGYNYRILGNSAVRKPRNNLLELDVLQMEYMLRILKQNKCLDSLPVKISFHNWKWQLAFSSLLENSIVVNKCGNAQRKSIFEDTCFFIRKYKNIYDDYTLNINCLYKKYRVFQFLYRIVPDRMLCFIYLGMRKIRGK